MCGLFGILGQSVSSLEINKCENALNKLKHRGPDQHYYYCKDNIFIGHTRLSILDLSALGTQPMVSEDENVVIAVNGEIYNFQNLKKELVGCKFISGSDSEVILHGYRRWGIEKLLNKIEGMFAFVIWDKNSNKIYLARDRVGIKPLYYGKVLGEIVWGSELKSIEEYFKDSNSLDLDYTALYDFLTYLYIPTPKTSYKNIYKLEPGHFIEIDTGNFKFKKKRYWNLRVGSEPMSRIYAGEKVFDILSRSISEQMTSDVNVGFFLSGGMDSSAVVCLAAKMGYSISSYSIGFNEKSHDESYFSKVVADHVQSKHISQKFIPDLSQNIFDFVSEKYDEPFADTSCLPTFEISKLARTGSKVVLTGDGGDELFGGYRWYNRYLDIRSYQLKNSKKLMLLEKLIGSRTCFERKSPSRLSLRARELDLLTYKDGLQLYSMLLGSVPWQIKKVVKEEFNIAKDYDDEWYFRKNYKPEFGAIKSLQYLDFQTYLPDDILTKVDRATMAVGLEARVPFLNTELIEFCFSLDEKTLHPDGANKSLLKEAVRKHIPQEILNRAKRGFSIPLKTWSKDILEGKHSPQEYIFDKLNTTKITNFD